MGVVWGLGSLAWVVLISTAACQEGRATHPKVLEPKVLDPKVLVTKVLGSLNQGINWLYPVSDVKSLIGFHFFINDLFHQIPVPLCTRGRLSSDETLSMVTRHRRCWALAASACASLGRSPPDTPSRLRRAWGGGGQAAPPPHTPPPKPSR